MDDKFILCTRATKGGKFIPEPGPSRYLRVPAGEIPSPAHVIPKTQWVKDLRKASTWGKDARNESQDRGDLLVFVHGYNNDLKIINDRHDQLKHDLTKVGFKGEIMTFCWPSDNKALNYVEDRHDAKQSAMQLVADGISILSTHQSFNCTINVHLLGHSTGAYVIREAFDDADDVALPNKAWLVSQIVFISGDVSSTSMNDGNSSTESLYRHCARLTNYFNQHDSSLKLSNAKRIGVAPRVGRVGLPFSAPMKAVDIDCSEYFNLLNTNAAVRNEDQAVTLGSFDHSWHIGNQVFTQDLFEILKGDLDRFVIPTRALQADGKLKLVRRANA